MELISTVHVNSGDMEKCRRGRGGGEGAALHCSST